MPNGQLTRTVDAKEVFQNLGRALSDFIETPIDESKVREIAAEEVARATLPRPLELHLDNGEIRQVEGRTHKQFEQLLELVAEGHSNLFMVGPAGSGKTTMAEQLAGALGREFGFLSLSAGVTETHLLGRVLPQSDGSWQYQPSRFVQVYENGGVFLLDEMDAADSNVLVAVNAALANGVLSNPVNGQLHKRHPDTIIIAAANTYGRGADQMYVGRNQLDAATLDRFVLSTLRIDYDGDLERDIARASLDAELADELIAWVNTVRGAISSYRLRRVASTRLVINGVKALKAGRDLQKVIDRYLQDWSADERAKVLA